MDEAQTLELQIKAKSQEAKASVDSLVKSLTNVENVLTNIYLELGSIEKKANTSTTNATSGINKIKSSSDKATSSLSNLTKGLSLSGAYIGVKRLTNQFLEWMNLSIDYTEQLNLFNVVFDNVKKDGVQTFSELGKSAIKFQNTMNERFGTNKATTLQYQSLFQSMSENLGVDDEYAYIMSESLTKLTYDWASLYNKTETEVAKALKAGVLAGQTEPLRNYGSDVTQQTLTPVLENIGITDRTVKQLTQAEKQILRYIAVMQQSSVAHADFANTIESPANQLKVFSQQLAETKVAITSLFMGTFANILPYANAFLMVIKEISRAIADMFGIEITDYNSGIASSEDSFVDLGDSIDGATDSVKELKRQTLGFDQINNINENKDNGGSGSSLTGGIDQRLLDAIEGYDNGMEQVRMKATQIRDSIMEWLGFTKEIDPLTGEVSFKLKEGYSNLKLIGGIIGTLVGYKIFKGLTNIAKGILGVDSLLTLSGENLTTIGKIVKSLKTAGWSATIAKIAIKLKNFLPIVGKVAGGIGGIATTILGSTGTYNAMKQMTKQTELSGKEFGNYAISVLETVGGATTLGAVIGGPLGAAIGGLTGTVVAGVSALFGYKQGIKELAEEDLFGNISISAQEWTDMLNNLNISISDNTTRFETLQTNLSNLGTTFDDSADKLDFYGFKFGELSQKITEEDSVNIFNAIENMCNSSSDIIDETTNYSLEIWGDAFSKMSVLTEDEEKDILKSIFDYGEKQKTEISNCQNNITETYKNAIETRGYLTDEEYNYISEQLQKIRDLTESEMISSQANLEYYKSYFKDKNNALDKQSYSEFKEALEQFEEEKRGIIEESYNLQIMDADKRYKQGVIDEEEYNNLLKIAYEQRNSDIGILNTELENAIGIVTENLKTKYESISDDNSKMAKEQKGIIESIFEDLNIDIKQVKDKFYYVGKSAGNGFYNGFYSIGGGGTGSFGGGGGGSRANGGVYSNGTWHNISQYANGGFPTHGSMFIAGEAGAEIVGHINGKTEVLNQSQIASAIYSAVASAMSQYSGGVAEINVHADEGLIVQTSINGIDQYVKQTGSLPFNIPVN